MNSLTIWNIQEEYDISGCRIDYIYSYENIGSPHAHLALFNGSIIYHRELSGLKPAFLY